MEYEQVLSRICMHVDLAPDTHTYPAEHTHTHTHTHDARVNTYGVHPTYKAYVEHRYSHVMATHTGQGEEGGPTATATTTAATAASLLDN